MGIFFKLSALDTHAQNSRVERFEQFIIKKVCTMRLSANLLYKLKEKIISRYNILI